MSKKVFSFLIVFITMLLSVGGILLTVQFLIHEEGYDNGVIVFFAVAWIMIAAINAMVINLLLDYIKRD